MGDVPTNGHSWSFFISLIFLIIAISMLMAGVLYLVYWRPTIHDRTCESTNNCDINQICEAGFCKEIICESDTDCPNGICINAYCTAYKCRIGNDCPTGTACVDGYCHKLGATCVSNSDCNNLSCLNTVCVQCLSDSNCPTGQGCFNQACRYPYEGETGTNLINYTSSAQNNGNITAPPGYFCTGTICGTGTNNQDYIQCQNNELCPSSCPFCVNSVCRCTIGEITESCRANADCITGLCDNGTCVPIGGECVNNFDSKSISCTNCCPVSAPYCVNGKCSNLSLGAICGVTGLPDDLCNNPMSLGAPGVTGVTSNGMGFFCVNGICQETPGGLNEQCTPGSCEFVNNGILVCTRIDTPSIPEMRCLKNT